MSNQQADEPGDAAIDASTSESEILALPHGSTTYKVLGEIDAPDGAGVLGHNTATSGTSSGVEGVTDSSDNFSSGVRGNATASNGIIYGVAGTTSSSTDLASGMHARYRGDAKGWGIGAITDSSAHGTAAVTGEATASSGVQYGVRGTTNSPDGYGLYTPDDAKIGETLQFTSGVSDMFIFESGTGNPDQNVISHSPSFPDWGLRYDDNGDDFVFQSGGLEDMTVRLAGTPTLDVHGDAQVEGTLSIDETGAAVYPGSGSTQTISSGTTTTVDFDTEETDPNNEFDTSNNTFSPDIGGIYRVNAQVLWGPTDPSSGTVLQIRINVNGGLEAQRRTVASGNIENTAISKVIPGLTSSDTVSIAVRHDEGSDLSLDDDSDDTYASFIRVG